jgi:hypothetical protein
MNDNHTPEHLADCTAAAKAISDVLYPAAETVAGQHGARMTVAGLIATAGQIAAAKGIPPGVFLEVAFASLSRMVQFHDMPEDGVRH